ncbi:MAG: hypothetical protein R3258_10465 [Acidimicrobiia bacterium]|nr:hypothetical protein [Acidimicrobiia bacterium]
MPLAALTGLLGAIAAGALSRSLVLDLIAAWPFWLTVVLLSVAVRRRRLGRFLLSGFAPLLALGGLATLTVAHVDGWPGLPSSEARLVGPHAEGVETAEIQARVDGELVVGRGDEFLYVVDPVRRGGTVAIPDALEEHSESHFAVVLGPPRPPGFYGFAGWDLMLASGPRWSLDLEGDLRADLTGLAVSDVRCSGSGVIKVGSVSTRTTITLSGDIELIVPEGTAVRVMGSAQVPSSWTALGDGWESPAGGDGWLVEVLEASTVTVTES